MRELIRLGWFPNMGPKEKFSLQLRLRSKIMAERQGFLCYFHTLLLLLILFFRQFIL